MTALDLVIGLPAQRSGPTDERLAGAVRSTLSRSPALRWQIILASPDEPGGEPVSAPTWGDADVGHVRYAPQASDALNIPYHGLPGRARALHAIIGEAHARQARACVIIDPRTPLAASAIEHLVQPLVDETADFVAPVYHRHPFTGAVVHGMVYPLFRAVYGARLRNPIGADLGCSRAFIERVVNDPIWQSDSGQIGVDLWLSATAAAGGFRLAQAQLGERIEERVDLDLGTILVQVLGFCFSDMERRAAIWQRVRPSREVPTFGRVPAPPAAPDVDVTSLLESFRLGSRELQDLWSQVLPPLAVLQWRRLANTPADSFRVDDELWARTIYDFAMGHRLRVITRDHLLRSLTPLYLAWLASFVREMRYLPPVEAEARIERLCLVFEAEKPYLVSQWRWPERFKPMKQRR